MHNSLTEITLQTLAQFSAGQDWTVQLAHSRAHHTLIWTTRGQGRVLLDGMRRGLGTHNAIWVPAEHLFAIELGAQSSAQVVALPVGLPHRLPQMPRQLRIRDVHEQTELTGLIEAAAREQDRAQPLHQDALEAHGALMSVWLRRQIMRDEHVPEKRNAAGRLSARFCAQVAQDYASGASMADYASVLGVTPTHLTRAVKAATGRTAADLLTQRILHAARCLLRDTSQPAQAVAAHLGFGSPAYFTRFIQHHTGKPPSKLRGG